MVLTAKRVTMQPITVLHVISGLEQGGAERTLFSLVTQHGGRFRHVVAPLREGGFWRAELERAGVSIVPLRLNGIADLPGVFLRLRAAIGDVRPDVTQSWLYHADLVAALATPRGTPLVWTLRNSDPRASGRWRGLLRALGALSKRPEIVVSNSARGLADHLALGYAPRRTLVILNGIDTERFQPASRSQARAAIGLSQDGLLIGMAARVDAFKDHDTFVRAAQRARAKGFAGAFVLAGAGTEALASAVDGVVGLGAVADMRSFYNALDIATLSSSHGEGFPNAVAEAMACGAPVVATDVGDTAQLLGQGGLLVPPRDAAALAGAWLALAGKTESERGAIGAVGRARVYELFSLPTMIAAYEQLYDELVGVSSNK